jgi:diguanylate cyclase (GGDEF)-like protein/PAS domain S-box-containing protein
MKKSGKKEENVVNKYKLIYRPLFIVLLVVLIVSISSFCISKRLMLSQMKQSGLNLVKQTTRQIEGNNRALDVVEEMLEEKIRIAGKIVINNEKELNESFLIELKEELNVDELHWMNEKGEILYTTVEGYRGWVAPKGHPLDEFSLSDNEELLEEIRLDAKFGIPIKYGAIKNSNGYIVQVGVLAKNIEELTKEFSYQTLVRELGKEENIAYATIIDKNLKTVVDSNIEYIGTSYDNEQKFEDIINGNVNMKELYCDEIDAKVLELSVPIFVKEEITGILVIGISMKQVYVYIYTIFITSFIIAFIMFFIFLWVQNINLIKPVNRLNKQINEIDVENNLPFRIPLLDNDPFGGVIISVNNLLDKIDNYFYQLKENQQELEASNEEIIAAYQQLSASEEEIRAQYYEIQNYTKKLESLKQKYSIAIEGTNCAVWEINLKDKTIYFSQEINIIFDIPYQKSEKIEEVLRKYLSVEDREKLIKSFIEYENGEKEEIDNQINLKDKDGDIKNILIRGKGIYDENREIEFINGILLDITTLKKQEAYIEKLAYNDPLTNLPNRRLFFKKLHEAIVENKSGAVILLDLDDFKQINDTLGHVNGDKVLKRVADELINTKSEKVFISRFGGDEFLLLIEGEKDIEKIEFYVKKITNIFKDKMIIEGNEIYISASIGITLYPSDSNDADQLIMNADMAMYKIKDSGKNNYLFFNEKMNEKLKKQLEIKNILRNAIKEGGFKLVYQPQICTYTGKIVGFEALLRLRDHNISPDIFISMAEENGMIVEIGKWVTKEAIKQMAVWQGKGMDIKLIAINFSAKQLNDLNYIEFLKDTLRETKVEAKHIEIEITESIFLDNKKETIVFLNKLKDLGIRIALDDFGTGYSSLSYLTFLPVDKIKLDKSLCDKFLEIENVSVMANIISLAHSLNLEVLAEGIENIEQYKRLKEERCNYIQGYLFSKPVGVDKVEKIHDYNFLDKIKLS